MSQLRSLLKELRMLAQQFNADDAGVLAAERQINDYLSRIDNPDKPTFLQSLHIALANLRRYAPVRCFGDLWPTTPPRQNTPLTSTTTQETCQRYTPPQASDRDLDLLRRTISDKCREFRGCCTVAIALY